jgi:dTDP-4-dehydrorhamnose reductase
MLWFTLFNSLKEKWYDVDITISSWSKNENEFVLQIESTQYTTILHSILRKKSYDYVINCIATLNTDMSDTNSINISLLTNIHLPKFLAENAIIYWYKNIHISSNWVFLTSWDLTYKDTDLPNDDTFYWLSKLLWEYQNNSSLVIRTSLIGLDPYHQKWFLEWILSHKENDIIEWHSNSLWNGITTLTFSEILCYIITNKITPSGVVHITWETISKKDIIELVSDIFQKRLQIKDNSIPNTTKLLIASEFQSNIQHIIPTLKTQLVILKDIYDKTRNNK